jgi:D-3-phosphoglycerate dehydrogenase
MRILQILPMYHPEGEKILRKNAEVIQIDTYEPDEVIANLGGVDGVILRSPAFIDKKILDHASSVKVISGAGVGLDNIDVEYASEKGIAVLHAPKVNTNATAEHAVGLIFSLLKNLIPFHREVARGNFQSRNEYFPFELKEKQLGLVGWGGIARRVAEICKHGLQMNVMAYVRSSSEEKVEAAKRIGVELTTNLDEIFKTSDIVSVHIPLTNHTDKLINKHHFSLMKQTSYFVNTARGGVVNENDLYTHLAGNRIAGAGLDVFSKEPPAQDHPFFSLDNVVLTPHIGGITEEAARQSSLIVAENVIKFLNGETPLHIANPEVLSDKS